MNYLPSHPHGETADTLENLRLDLIAARQTKECDRSINDMPEHTVGEERKWLPSLLGWQNLRKDCLPSSNHSR